MASESLRNNEEFCCFLGYLLEKFISGIALFSHRVIE